MSAAQDAFNRIPWIVGAPDTIDGAFAQARAQGKLLLLVWGSEEKSAAIQQLTATVFNRADFAAQLAHYVPVFVDSATIGGQKLAESFRIQNSPEGCMLLLAADHSEIMFISADLEPSRYAQVLELRQPELGTAKNLLTTIADSEVPLSLGECRRLAYSNWLHDQDTVVDTDHLRSAAVALELAAKRCPSSAKVERARLIVQAALLASAVVPRVNEENRGKGVLPSNLNPDLIFATKLLEQLFVLLRDTPLMVEVSDCLEVLNVILVSGPKNTLAIDMDELFRLYSRVAEEAAQSPRLPPGAQASMLFKQLDLATWLSPWGGKVELPALSIEAQERLERILGDTKAPLLRPAIIVEAYRCYTGSLKEPEKARTLLEAETRVPQSPNFYKTYIAEIDKKAGRAEQALSWLKGYYADARGEAARLDAGIWYVRNLMQLRPADSLAIRDTALAALDRISGPDLVPPLSRTKLQLLENDLKRWNGDGQHADDARAIQRRIEELQEPPTKTLEANKIAEKIRVLAEMAAAGVANPGENPESLNELGYQAMYEKKNLPKALRYFQWNIILFPKFEAALTDSLAEGYLQSGDAAHALELYTKALAVDTRYRGANVAQSIVAALKSGPAQLPALQDRMHKAYLRDLERARAQDEAKKRQAEVAKNPLEMKFTAIDKREIDASKLRGKVVLVDFWATWCGPCVKEIPTVVAAYNLYHDKGFEVVGITLDKDSKPPAEILEFAKNHQMPWPQCFDAKRGDQAFAKQFGIESIPAMFLVDQDGMIVSTNARGPKLDEEVRRLLKLPPLGPTPTR